MKELLNININKDYFCKRLNGTLWLLLGFDL